MGRHKDPYSTLNLHNLICEAIYHKRKDTTQRKFTKPELLVIYSYLNIVKDLAQEVRRRMESAQTTKKR